MINSTREAFVSIGEHVRICFTSGLRPKQLQEQRQESVTKTNL